MNKFTEELVVKKIGDQVYELVEPLVYENEVMVVQVNPKFDFDAISIPKVMWSLVDSPFTGKAVRAAVLHDALYASEYFDREICDKLFLEAMKSDGVSYIKRMAMYNAVRMFGWTVWKGHKREEVDEYKKFVTVIDNNDA